MDHLSRLNDRINSAVTLVVIVFVLVMTLIVGYQVFRRYVMNASLIWSAEAARYLLVWISFLGSSVALRKGGHINVTAIVNLFSNRPRSFKIITLAAYAVISVTLLVIIAFGIRFGFTNMEQLSPALRIPIGIVYFCIPIGCSLMMLQMVERIWGTLKGLK